MLSQTYLINNGFQNNRMSNYGVCVLLLIQNDCLPFERHHCSYYCTWKIIIHKHVLNRHVYLFKNIDNNLKTKLTRLKFKVQFVYRRELPCKDITEHVRMIKMCLKKANSEVRICKYMSYEFPIQNSLK